MVTLGNYGVKLFNAIYWAIRAYSGEIGEFKNPIHDPHNLVAEANPGGEYGH